LIRRREGLQVVQKRRKKRVLGQTTPELYNRDDQKVIPAESVYGVLEVKQELDKANVGYAGEKVASVRALHRTSADITHAGGKHGPVEPKHILGGILATTSGWNPPLGDAFEASIRERPADERIDLGCCVAAGGFDVDYEETSLTIEKSAAKNALAFFFIRLLRKLQQIGTVPAIDYDAYLRGIEK